MERRDFIRRTGLTGVAGIGAMSLQSFAPAPEQTSDTRFNVLDFGAKGDGKTSDTEAIQKALDEAGKVNGTVWFP
nr:glycoside hydrolase family 55 protein [Bacteroidaceae bacterium]